MTRVIALVATIPARRPFCEGLLAALARQSRPPDAVLLVLDDYGETPPPACPLPILGIDRADKKHGPWRRWCVALDYLTLREMVPGYTREEGALALDDILVCVDDDAVLLEAPEFIAGLVMAVERGGGAAGAMGTDYEGKPAPPGAYSRGRLIHAAGLGLTVRAQHLIGLPAFAAEVVAAGGPDIFTPVGDDDALVSAHLWKTGVTITHAVTGNVFEVPAAKVSSQSVVRGRSGEKLHAQKMAIRKVTGWPFQARVDF